MLSPRARDELWSHISSVVDLPSFHGAACAIAAMVCTGEVEKIEAVDRLENTARARGLGDGIEGDIQGILASVFGFDNDAMATRASFPVDELSSDQLDARALAQSSTSATPRVSAVTLEEFLAMEFPLRSMMLTPWLPVQGLAMVYAPRGTGKTRMAHGVAHAIATGSGFLCWSAPEPKRVLLLDGEMPAAALQEMLRATVQASGGKPPDPTYFRIVAADTLKDGLPDLTDPAAQQLYRDVVADADLLVIDNLSTLCRRLKENDGDSFTPVQDWLLSLRRAGKSAFLVHHAGKTGSQRGTSRKEDVLDTVISLRRPPDYLAEQGARFEVHFEKSREFHGADAEPFEARLLGDQWQISPIRSGDDDETLKALRKQGLSIRDIAERTGRSKSDVQRRVGGGGGDDDE